MLLEVDKSLDWNLRLADELTAPVSSSRPLKFTVCVMLGLWIICGMAMKQKLMSSEMMLNMSSHFRKRKYERTEVPKRPPISFSASCHITKRFRAVATLALNLRKN